jgi:hypothetical protein
MERSVGRREFIFAAAGGALMSSQRVGAEGRRRDLPEFAELPATAGLPDPLVFLSGQRVATPTQWRKQRRAELRRLFQHYMYGYFPARPSRLETWIEREDPAFLGGRAAKREIAVRIGPRGAAPLRLLLVAPNDRSRPAPVFLGIAFCGNHAVVRDPSIPVSDRWAYPGEGVVGNRATEAARGSAADVWNVEKVIDRGYAIATFYNGDVEPDYPDAPDGIRARMRKPGAPRGKHEWGAIAAWAWGMHRAVDALQKQPEIDPTRIAAVGHSRNGKATLLAAAFDDRIALAIPHQAGCGGTAPSRGTVGESVARINTAFPHWFCDAFKEFNDEPQRLPFDQHCLAALMAPRPVLFSNAVEDTWANPAGQFEVLRAADKVYRFLGVEGLSADRMPPEGRLVASRLGYFIRPGRHSMTALDWDAFLDFADRHLK